MLAARNHAYQCETNIENLGYVRVFDADSAHAADQQHIVVGQFGLEWRRTHASQVLSMPRIFSRGTPLKVGDHVIGPNRINMVDHRKPVRVGYEGHSDQPVDAERKSFPILTEDQSGVFACGFVGLRLHNVAGTDLNVPVLVDDFASDAPDATQTADFVAPFVSNDRSPFLDADDIHVVGCLSGNDGLAIKDPPRASTFGGSAIMALTSVTYNRRLPSQSH